MGYGRAMVWGAATGLLVVALALVAFVLVGPSLRAPMTVPGDRVLLVVGSQGATEDGEVAQLVGIADIAGSRLTVQLVDPLTTVTVPGTTYTQLRDAYAFGGGPGVSTAVASITGGKPLPVIALGQRGLVDAVDRSGGVTITVPSVTSVFDGKRLYTFAKGPQHLGGTDVVALLSSAEYADTAVGQLAVRSAIASGLAEALASGGRVAMSDVSSSLRPDDLGAVGQRLRAALPGLTIAPFAQ